MKKIWFFIGILIVGLTTFGSASRTSARAVQTGPSDQVATSVYQTVQAMITPTPTVSIKALKIAILVNQTLEAYLTGTPTPERIGNLETAVYGTIEALKPTATLSGEDAEIATAVHRTVQAFMPTATPTKKPESVVGTALAATVESLQQMMAATRNAAPAQPTKSVWGPPPTAPGPIATPVPCESFRYVADVTIPDGTVMTPGQSFQKTWRVLNTGSCVWSTAYQFVFARGDQLNAPAGVSLTRNVNPGETIDITVPMSAPMTNGTYRGNWLLRNPSGQLFGMGAGGRDGVWVDIRVQGSGAPPPSVPLQFRCEHVSTVFNDVRMPDGIDAIRMTINLKNTGSAPWSKDSVDLVFTSARFWTDGYIKVGQRYDLADSVSPGNSATFTVICDECYDDLFESPANNVIWTLMSGSDRICEIDLTQNKIENW